jgi:YhcG PDDEXK nuclease domain
LRGFAKTTAKRSAASVVSSSCYANAWAFSPKRSWLSTAASLRRYHRDRNFTSAKLARLRCLVIIDLKLTELNHVDVGQMHMYCNYAREHWTSRGESPPVGLILGTRANAAVARYAEVYIDVNDEMQRGAVDLA